MSASFFDRDTALTPSRSESPTVSAAVPCLKSDVFAPPGPAVRDEDSDYGDVDFADVDFDFSSVSPRPSLLPADVVDSPAEVDSDSDVDFVPDDDLDADSNPSTRRPALRSQASVFLEPGLAVSGSLDGTAYAGSASTGLVPHPTLLGKPLAGPALPPGYLVDEISEHAAVLADPTIANVESPRRRGRRRGRNLPAAHISKLRAATVLDIRRMQYTCPKCGAAHFLGERKDGSPKSNPIFHRCCGDGDIAGIEKIPPPPKEQRELLTSNSPRAVEFRRKIRAYNGALAFTSFIRGEERRPHEYHPVTIHGEAYHLGGSMFNDRPEKPRYAQLYFYDPVHAADRRGHIFPSLDGEVLLPLTDMIHRENSYYAKFASAWEMFKAKRVPGKAIFRAANLQIIYDERTDRYVHPCPFSEFANWWTAVDTTNLSVRKCPQTILIWTPTTSRSAATSS